MNKNPHIMLWRFSSMGDLAILEPVLRNFLHQYPNTQLTLVSRPKFQAFFRPLKQVNYLAIDFDQAYKGPQGLWQLASRLQQLQPDYILDLHQVLRTIILRQYFRWRWGIPIPYIDKGRAEKRALAAPKAHKIRQALKPTYQRYADLFAKIGFPIAWEPPLAAPSIYPLNEKLKTLLSKSQVVIGIAPFGRYESKTYPPDLTAKLLKQLLIDYPNAKIYLFGGGEMQKSYFEQWSNSHPQIHNLANRFSLEEELSLMTQLDLMIAVDSANMHMAAMLERPVLSLWGPTHPYFGFYPWQQPLEYALTADLEKYPTLPSSFNGKKTDPNTADCMRSITVAQILLKVRQILGF